jgi:hypothetical protein
MSYNSWLYTYGNPTNYTDPTGLISEKNAEEARNIVNDLITYNVHIKVDWGYQYVPFHTQCGWNEGDWIMPDLKAIQASVHIIDKGASFLGGNFKSLIGKVTYVPKKGGKDGKGDSGNNYLAGTVPGMITWYMPNWKNEEDRLWVAVHEMGHVVAYRNPKMMDYFMGELGAHCSNQPVDRVGYYCNSDQDPSIIYDPGKSANGTQNIPSEYALHGSYEDFAETWREVVTRAYIRSGDAVYIRQAWIVYNHKLNHDIGRRRKVMNSIINGSWK